MRFDPPPVSLPDELGWLLDAAFGPTLPPLNGEPERIAELARQFDLGPRIVARHGAPAVEHSLGGWASESIRAHRRGVAIALAADLSARQLASTASAHGLSVIFLKGYALQQTFDGPTGWRPFVDLDLLLERPDAERLAELLAANGWTRSTDTGNPQHLPPLASAEGIPIDIHYRLRGIRVAAARWATANELLAAGLCRPADLGAGCWLPGPALLAAHVTVHALEQHGNRPATYPLLRAVADLVDLIARGPDEQMVAAVRRLTRDSLAEDETRAIFELAERFAGRRGAAGSGADGAAAEILLRHIVAGVMDSGYRASLALDHTAGRLREARRDGELMRYIARKLQGLDGPATVQGTAAQPGSWHRKIRRPIHLCARFATAAAARLRRALDR